MKNALTIWDGGDGQRGMGILPISIYLGIQRQAGSLSHFAGGSRRQMKPIEGLSSLLKPLFKNPFFYGFGFLPQSHRGHRGGHDAAHACGVSLPSSILHLRFAGAPGRSRLLKGNQAYPRLIKAFSKNPFFASEAVWCSFPLFPTYVNLCKPPPGGWLNEEY